MFLSFFIPEPRSFEVGMLVWLKHQKYPFWPAVVSSGGRGHPHARPLMSAGPRGSPFLGETDSLVILSRVSGDGYLSKGSWIVLAQLSVRVLEPT